MIAVFGFVTLASRAYAFETAGKCERPTVFSGAAVNVVILPYRSDSVAARPLGPQALQFTVLMQLEMLFSILKYGSVGVTRLVATPKELAAGACQVESVLPKLLGSGRGTLSNGHGLVLVWGSFYEEGSDLYVQTYVRFLRRERIEEYALPVQGTTFLGRLPVSSVALPPIRVTGQDLDNISREFERIVAVHESRSESSPSQRLPTTPQPGTSMRGTAFSVLDAQDGWMQVRSDSGDVDGWVHLGGIESGFRQLKAPKLSFVEGIVGYLREFVGRNSAASRAPAGTLQATERAFERFLQTASESNTAGNSPSLAITESILGVLELFGDQPSPTAAESALPYFRRAARLMPYSADLRDLELVTQLYLAYAGRGEPTRADQFANAFGRAAALEPDNRTAVANLMSYYQLLIDSGPPPAADPAGSITAVDLDKRLAALRAITVPRN